jgi:hypothetical protein
MDAAVCVMKVFFCHFEIIVIPTHSVFMPESICACVSKIAIEIFRLIRHILTLFIFSILN